MDLYAQWISRSFVVVYFILALLIQVDINCRSFKLDFEDLEVYAFSEDINKDSFSEDWVGKPLVGRKRLEGYLYETVKEDINGADVFHYALNFGGWGPEIAHMQSLMMCREENLSGKEFQIRTLFLQNFEAGKVVQFTGIIEEISRDGLVLSNCYLSEN